MGKASDALEAFINNLPDSKLTGFTDGGHTLCSNTNFRLDHQGLTTGKPQYYNLQVQINNQTKISTIQKAKGRTVATALVPTDGSWDAQMIRDELLANSLL